MPQFLFILLTLLISLPSAVLAEDGETVYRKICHFCHEDGLLGSPMFGDAGAWEERRKQDIEELYNNTIHGKGHMIERLDRRGFTEQDIKNAVDYILENSK